MILVELVEIYAIGSWIYYIFDFIIFANSLIYSFVLMLLMLQTYLCYKYYYSVQLKNKINYFTYITDITDLLVLLIY